jgi:hypothetical protein
MFSDRLYSGLNPNNERSSVVRACSHYEGVILFLESLGFKIQHHQLLPKPSRINLHRCKLWSNEQLNKIAITARQIINIKSVKTHTRT